MTTLITKSPFYVRPVGPDGTARQEYVRLQPGAVLRQMGSDWTSPMPWQTSRQMAYRVLVESGVDDEGCEWAGKLAFVRPERFTDALVKSKMTPELEASLMSADISDLAR